MLPCSVSSYLPRGQLWAVQKRPKRLDFLAQNLGLATRCSFRPRSPFTFGVHGHLSFAILVSRIPERPTPGVPGLDQRGAG
jgi:hypothetical protein